jgi:hypothetical protein
MHHTPSLPEIVRVDTSSLKSAISRLVSFLEPIDGGFNYLDATRRVQTAYRGLHSLSGLTASPTGRQSRVGHLPNMDVVKTAAPLAFGRSTRVFHLSARKLPYGDGRLASFRIPFFFAEDGKFFAYFLQPRKNTHFTPKQFGLLATVVKSNLLESEFYGEQFDVELVDVSKPIGAKDRIATIFSFANLELWSDVEVSEHFRVVNEALRIIENEHLVTKARRPLKDSQLPMF